MHRVWFAEIRPTVATRAQYVNSETAAAQRLLRDPLQASDIDRNELAILPFPRRRIKNVANPPQVAGTFFSDVTDGNERSRFASEFSKSKSNSVNGPSELESEVKRIEQMIQVIATLIDNPETELSTVIRKNVEKAELGAYLRGILFSLGKGKAL